MTADPLRTAAIEVFYRDHRATLEKKVANRVSGASRALIEDACQSAWMALLRRLDIDLDQRGLAWLAIVATREAWRATSATEIPTGAYALAGDRGFIAEPGAHPGPTLDERAADRERHQQRVGDLAQLKPAERQTLGLKALGYSYAEIGQLTGASYTAVNRRLAEGRAALRRFARDRQAAYGTPG
jgi:DNA-directed RNA polymerase specialized sigma24 family protein